MDFSFIAEQVDALNKQYQAGYNGAKEELRLRLRAVDDKLNTMEKMSQFMDILADFLK